MCVWWQLRGLKKKKQQIFSYFQDSEMFLKHASRQVWNDKQHVSVYSTWKKWSIFEYLPLMWLTFVLVFFFFRTVWTQKSDCQFQFSDRNSFTSACDLGYIFDSWPYDTSDNRHQKYCSCLPISKSTLIKNCLKPKVLLLTLEQHFGWCLKPKKLNKYCFSCTYY